MPLNITGFSKNSFNKFEWMKVVTFNENQNNGGWYLGIQVT